MTSVQSLDAFLVPFIVIDQPLVLSRPSREACLLQDMHTKFEVASEVRQGKTVQLIGYDCVYNCRAANPL